MLIRSALRLRLAMLCRVAFLEVPDLRHSCFFKRREVCSSHNVIIFARGVMVAATCLSDIVSYSGARHCSSWTTSDPDTYYAQAEPKDWPEATGWSSRRAQSPSLFNYSCPFASIRGWNIYRNCRKKARMSSAKSLGSSAAAKWPPCGISVQCWML